MTKHPRSANFTQAIKKGEAAAGDASFLGIPLDDMSHDELVGVVGYLFNNPGAKKYVNPALTDVKEET